MRELHDYTTISAKQIDECGLSMEMPGSRCEEFVYRENGTVYISKPFGDEPCRHERYSGPGNYGEGRGLLVSEVTGHRFVVEDAEIDALPDLARRAPV